MKCKNTRRKTYLNIYICKVGMPPTYPLIFRLIPWNE